MVKENKRIKKIRNDNNKCIGYGKCYTIEVEDVEDTADESGDKLDEEDENNSLYDDDIYKKEDNNSNSCDDTNDITKMYPQSSSNIRTLFRFEKKAKCKFKCKLHKCENYKSCGNSQPQWSLNLGRGLCDQCVIEGVSTRNEELKRRYTI